MRETDLVADISSDVLKLAHAHARDKVAHLLPVSVRGLGKVEAVDGASTCFSESHGHLEPDPAVRPGDERDPVGEREVLGKERGGYSSKTDVSADSVR